MEVGALVVERQRLYEKFTMPMSGKNLKMLKGYNPQSNEKTDKLATVYKQATIDPLTRYNCVAFNFNDSVLEDDCVASRHSTEVDQLQRSISLERNSRASSFVESKSFLTSVARSFGLLRAPERPRISMNNDI